MLVTHICDFNRKLTAEEKEMLEEAENAPFVPDEDCPELTDEQLSQFRRISEKRQV